MISMTDPLGLAGSLMNFGNFTVWAMTEPDHFEKAVKIMHERNMENLRRSLDIKIMDAYRITGPEFATPPCLPPEFFERFSLPYIKEMVDLIHNKGALVRIHCHGKIRQILAMLQETGADAIDPCEAPPDGDITMKEIKDIVGNKLCLFGNIQLKLLEQGTKAEIDKTVKECMDGAKRDGGFVITTTADPINEPLSPKTEENYIYFIEKSLEYGRY
jgi:uroporphyrinogen decarboxylase